MLARVVFLGLGLVAFTACGLTVTGSAVDDGIGEDASSNAPVDGNAPRPDGSAPRDGAVDPDAPGPETSDACTLPSAQGFALVLFGDATRACPNDFATGDVVENPTAGANACACGDCSATIDCSSGLIKSYYDSNAGVGSGTCGTPGTTIDPNGGACRNMAGRFGEHAKIDAPTASVGACTSPGLPSRGAVTTQGKRICIPASATAATAACTPPADMKACLVADGDLNCPANAPTKHLVGTDFDLTCGACGCQVTAACTGKIEFFGQSNCAGTPGRTLNVGSCSYTGQDNFTSLKWTGSVATQTCTKQPAPAPSVALTGQRTVCCP